MPALEAAAKAADEVGRGAGRDSPSLPLDAVPDGVDEHGGNVRRHVFGSVP